MGLVNTVVPLEELEAETVQWAQEILANSPMALRFLKAAFNADTDGLVGIQQLAGDATLLYYTTDEAKEGRDAFKEKTQSGLRSIPSFPLIKPKAEAACLEQEGVGTPDVEALFAS